MEEHNLCKECVCKGCNDNVSEVHKNNGKYEDCDCTGCSTCHGTLHECKRK